MDYFQVYLLLLLITDNFDWSTAPKGQELHFVFVIPIFYWVNFDKVGRILPLKSWFWYLQALCFWLVASLLLSPHLHLWEL